MNRKIMKKKRIIPRREKCDCGKQVKNHHWLCDKCWGKKNRLKEIKKKKKLKQGRPKERTEVQRWNMNLKKNKEEVITEKEK